MLMIYINYYMRLKVMVQVKNGIIINLINEREQECDRGFRGRKISV